MSILSNVFKQERIFLDFASTTPIITEVKKEMEKYLFHNFYNPSAIYKEGTELRDDLLRFRKKVAKILHASYKDVIFTSGGTESNNQALFGVFEAVKEKITNPHFIISTIEHSAIAEAAKEIKKRGGELTIIGVNEEGRVNLEEVKNSIKQNTVLVSIMLANNEIGTIEPVSKISRIIKEHRTKKNSEFPYFHSDASQGANFLSLDLTSLGVDLLTLDGSKIYGPKGVGALIVRQNVLIKPIIFGGGQERGLRSGTENIALIAGFTKALELAQINYEREFLRLEDLKNYFVANLIKEFPKIIINNPTKNSLPNIVSISIPDAIGEFVAIKLDQAGIMVSTGSSCGIFKDIGGSTTLIGIGKEELAESTIRFSFGITTTQKQLKKTIQALKKILFQ